MERVVEHLQQRDVEPAVIRPSSLATDECKISLRHHLDGIVGELEGVGLSQPVHVGRNTRVWRRRPSRPGLATLAEEEPAIAGFIVDQYRLALESLYSIGVASNWMNTALSDRALDQNKLLGNCLAAQAGLRTIPTLCTDNPAAYIAFVQSFSDTHSIAVKPAASWSATLGEDGTLMGVFTQKLSPDRALSLSHMVRHAPVLVQPYLEKQFELRITVVGKDVFACRMDTQATPRTSIDWRHYDLDNTEHSAYELDRTTTFGILKFMDLAGLRFCALDLIVSPSGRVVFVEANPCGQYGWVEEAADLPISAAIADWLLASAHP